MIPASRSTSCIMRVPHPAGLEPDEQCHRIRGFECNTATRGMPTIDLLPPCVNTLWQTGGATCTAAVVIGGALSSSASRLRCSNALR